jgi:hypothetical protein
MIFGFSLKYQANKVVVKAVANWNEGTAKGEGKPYSSEERHVKMHKLVAKEE